MLGLPKSTELNKQLPKKAIYEKFNMNRLAKEKFDDDIKKLVIVNEISTSATAIDKGTDVTSFFVIHVLLKTDSFDEKNIILISRLINQKILFILEYEGEAKLALYHTKLMQTDWAKVEELTIQLKGLNLDSVWENIVVQVGNVQIEHGNTLEEQISIDETYRKIEKQILQLDKKSRAEKQPKRKFELAQEIKALQRKLEESNNGQTEDA